MKLIALFLAPGFEEIEAVSIIDVLRRAGFPVTTVSVSGDRLVTGSHEITIMADHIFQEYDPKGTDMIILPGGMPGTVHLYSHTGLMDLIKKFATEKKPIGAICAAPMILGNMGILNGKEATCFPGFEKYLEGAKVKDKKIVTYDHIITGKGPGCAIEFALGVITMLSSKENSDKIRKTLMME
jgi:protein deglycase